MPVPYRIYLVVIIVLLGILANNSQAEQTHPAMEMIEKGRAHFLAKRYKDAEKAYRRAQKLAKNSHLVQKARFGIAECQAAQKRFKSAEELFAKALSALTDNTWQEKIAKKFILLGDEKLEPADSKESADPVKAEKFYRAALDIGIKGELAEEIELKIANSLSKQKKYFNAAEHLRGFSSKYKDSPRAAEAKYLAAEAYHKINRQEDARSYLRDIIVNFPKSAYAPKASFLLSRTYNMPEPKQNFDLAWGLQALQEFIQKFPQHKLVQQVRLEMALAPLYARQHAAAQKSLVAYLKTKGPEEYMAKARYFLGKCLAEQEKYDQAITAWKDYIKHHPSAEHWLSSMQGIEDMVWKKADAAFEKKNWQTAAKLYYEFVQKYPAANRTPLAYLKAGKSNLELGKFKVALADFNLLTSKFAQDKLAAEGLYQTGLLYEERFSDFSKARDLYKKATKAPGGSYAAVGRLNALDQPSLVIDSPPTFRSRQPAVLDLHTRNIESLTLRLYRIQAEDFFRDRMEMNEINDLDIALCTADKKWTVPIKDYRKYKRIKQRVPLKIDKPGLYVVHVSTKELEATTAVKVSDLGMIMKTGPGSVFVFTQDMKKTKVWPRVKVVLASGKNIIAEGTTGPDGVFKAAFLEDENLSDLRALAVDGDQLTWAEIEPIPGQPETASTPRAFLLSDRPAYQPGSQVGIAGIVRDRWDKGYPSFRDNSTYNLQVFTPDNKELVNSEVFLDQFGMFDFQFKLDPAAPVGRYSYTLKAKDKTQFSASFEVVQYRTNPFELSVEFDQPILFRGQTLEGVIRVKHRGGTNAAFQQVYYLLSGHDNKWQIATSDKNGQVRFSYPTLGFDSNSQAIIKVKLPKHNITNQFHAYIAIQEYQADLNLPQKNLFAGQPFDLAVRVSGPDDKPKGARLRLTATKVLAKTNAEISVFEKDIVVPEDGRINIPVSLPEDGRYTLRVFGVDRKNHPIVAELALTTHGKEKPGFFLDIERSQNTLNSPAKITIDSRMKKALVLLTYETDQVIGYKTVKVKKGINKFKIALNQEMVPNFSLAAAAMEADKFYTAARNIEVSRELDITIRADKKNYQPGDEVTLTLIAKDKDGHLVDSQIIVNVIDQALLDIYPEKLGDLLQTFYFLRPMEEILTISSNTHRFASIEATEIIKAKVQEKEGSAAMDALGARRRAMTKDAKERFAELSGLGIRGEGAGGGGYGSAAGHSVLRGRIGKPSAISFTNPTIMGGLGPLREMFDQALLFFPKVRTGPDGVASLTFKLPDSITSWQVAARGVSRDTQLGEAKTKLVASRKFWAELLVPPELEDGDRLQPVVRLFNESSMDLEVDFKLTSQTNKCQRQVKVSAKGTSDVYCDHIDIVKKAEDHQVEFIVDARSKYFSDRLKKKIPVRRAGIRDDITLSGRLERRIARSLTLDKDLENPSLEIKFDSRLSRLFLAGRLDPILFGNRPEESLVALNILRLLGPTAEQTMTSMVQSRLKQALVSLLLAQNDDGGWGYGPRNHSDLVITARAVRALSRARKYSGKLNWTFPQADLAKAITILKTGLPGLLPEDFTKRAAILYALAHEGSEHVPVVHLHRLHRLRINIPLQAKALLGLTWQLLGRPEKAAEVSEVIKQTKWTDSVRALELLAETDPNDPQVAKGRRWLLEQSNLLGWSFPNQAEAATAALYKVLGAETSGQRFRVKVVLNKKQVGSVTGSTPTITVDSKLLRSGENKLELIMEGGGSVFYTATLSGYRTQIPTPTRDIVRLHRTIEPIPLPYRGHYINAGFSTVLVGEKRWQNLIEHIPAQRQIEVSLHIRHDHDQPLSLCVLTDRIPPGFELVPESLHIDHRRTGRKLAFYLTRVHRSQTIKYRLQAINPGSYQFVPLRLVSLINPQTNYYSTSTKFKIDPHDAKPDDLRPTPDELHQVGMLAFDAKDYKLCIEKLEQLDSKHELKDDIAIKVWAKLLMAAIELEDQQRIVKYFELAKEKNPNLVIAFEKLAPIQTAYRKLKSYEAGLHLARGVAEARLLSDIHSVGVLQSEGEVAEAIALFRRLINTYPDSQPAAQATYDFSQVLFDRADKIREGEELKGFDRPGLLSEVIDLMARFLSFFPKNPQGPLAIYSIATALLEKENPQEAVKWCQRGISNFPESDLVPAMTYMKAFAHFKLGEYESSLKLCRQIEKTAEKEENREMARYIMAQIYHSRGQMAKALELYEKVKDRFIDAWETIAESKKTILETDEVLLVEPGKNAILPLTIRNLESVNLRAYSIDPVKLYQLKGSLNQLTEVNLAGIQPVFSRDLRFAKQLGVTRKIEHNLRLPKTGAYLVLVRGADKLLYSIVLNGALTTDVEQDYIEGREGREGRVRVTVKDKRGRPVVGARIQLKGLDDDLFFSGKTDLRGIFIADNINGPATVIASHDGLYGIYRGKPLTDEELEFLDEKDKLESPPKAYEQQSTFDFSDETIEGNLVAPDNMFIQARKVRGMSANQAH
jgi:TolA-binding protein